MPLATDALLGDHFASMLAERLGAFAAPTVRVGCSSHHLGFAGTLSIEEETFHAIVIDLVGSLLRSGFGRIVLIPTHGGNYAPLAAALEKLDAGQRRRVVALTDLTALFEIARQGEAEHGVPLGEGGLHAGEWETSMMLAVEPELVEMERAEPGFTGDIEEAVGGMFSGGVSSISENGVVGDPTRASAEHGRRYWEAALELALDAIRRAS
jgi:creatinine amidohydrolase/Fe(II)-dependent formamide hydrolase-like protein